MSADGRTIVGTGIGPEDEEGWIAVLPPAFDDGIDNDGQPGTDFDGGLSALGFAIDSPDPQCVGLPWKNKEQAPSCGVGFESVLVLGPLLVLRACRRRRP